MQQFSPEYAAEIQKGHTEPWRLVDGYEFYAPDYIPGPDGFDPADAIERFAGQEITWNGFAYRREVISRSDITLNVGEKTNSVSIQFSNISRYLALFAQSQTIEGMLLCIRCIAPAVTNDSKAMFHGRCDKPGDVTKKSFPLTARQDFGNLNQTAPPDKFNADDPNGRLIGDPLYEGIPFISVPGTYVYPFVQPSSGTIGRLLQRRETVNRNEQWSAVASTPYGTPIPEVFGRCQMELIPFNSIDKGIYLGAMWAACKGPIKAIENIKTRQPGLSDPLCTFEPQTPAAVHLGDPGGTGTNQGNTCQADLGGGLKFSRLAYVDGAIIPTEYFQNPSLSDPNVLNELPTVTALILGRKVPLPNASGDYTLEDWTDNLVHIARFILTDPSFVNINSGFMEDAINYLTGLHCDEPILDESESQLIIIDQTDINQAGVQFERYRSTGLITPRSILYDHFGGLIVPEIEGGPYIGFDPSDPPDFRCPIGQHRDPNTGECVADVPGPVINATQGLLRKRYTGNFPITEEIRVVDLLYKVILPAFRGYLKVTGKGKLAICSEIASSATRLRSATAVGARSIPVLDATPWKSGPELLQGEICISGGQIHSETRRVTSADYSTSGNSISLSASGSGGVTATASGATLAGGSTTVQASGTITLGGTPNGTVTVTIDGVSVAYILSGIDTLGTAASMLKSYINATKKLRQYIIAEWSAATPTVITIRCLHGALNLSSPLLKVHGGPIANPTTAPTIAAGAGGSLQAGTYQVAYADVNANGLTALTLLATVVLTAGQKINVSALPAFPAGVTSRQFFVSEKVNSSALRYQATRNDAADFSINALPLPNAALPPSQNTTAEELIRVAMAFATNSQDVFPARKPSTAVILNDIYLPDPLNGHKYQATAITTGITGSGTPAWPTAAGGTVVDGGVTWTEIGSTVLQQTGLTRANILKDTYRWPLGSMQSSVNVVEIPFRDATNDFALTTLRINDAAHQAQVKKKFPLKIDGSAIDNYNQAYRVGSAELSKNREGDWFNALEGSPAALVLEEGDLIASSDDSGGHVNVITRIEEIRIKPNHTVAITKARKYSTAMFSDEVGSHTIPIASTLRHVQTVPSTIEFIDNYAIRDADALIPGFYTAVSRALDVAGDWRGYTVYADYGDGYAAVGQGSISASTGEASTTLGTVSDPSVWDRVNSLTFTLDFQETEGVAPFTTVDEQHLLANSRRNLFIVGNEYIQAATVVDNGNRSYTISTLLRGRFGTDTPTHLTHGASERVVFLNGAEAFIEIDPVRLNGTFNYKAVTTNQDVADATAVPFTWTGGTVKPLAPVNLRGIRNPSGDLLIRWTRRSRIAPGLTPGTDVPLAEERDSFLIDIYSGATLKRSIPVAPATSQGVIWAVTNQYASIVGSTLKSTSSTQMASAQAHQEFSKTGVFYEFTIKKGATTTFLTSAIFWTASDGYRQGLNVVIGDSEIDIRSQRASEGVFESTTVKSNVPYSNGDRLRVVISGTEVRFYLNYAATGVTPFYISPLIPQFPVKVEAFTGGDIAELQNAVIYNGDSSTIYSAAQQTEDFGSVQSTVGSVKTRATQVSAVVGRGPYVEALL